MLRRLVALAGRVCAAALPRESAAYDLDVNDQWLLLTLRRFGPSTFRRLHAELEALRAATPAHATESLLKLEGLGLIERLRPPGIMADEPRFGLRRAGRAVVQNIPAAPRSPTTFYS